MIQVIQNATGEILYTVRATSNRFKPPVYAAGEYKVKVGKDKPDLKSYDKLQPVEAGKSEQLKVRL